MDQQGTVYTSQPVSVSGFSTQFQFQLVNPNADGITFTIQGDGPTTLAPDPTGGGGLGVEGIANNVSIKFDLYNNNGEGDDSTGLYTDGATPDTPATDLTSSGIDLHSGDVFGVAMSYNGTTLDVTITDATTGASATQAYTVNIPSIVGGNTAYVGFTGATGGLTATQSILNWVYSPTSNNTNALPSGWTSADIGTPPIAGSSTYNDGVFTVTGSGTDIWDNSDQFQYASEAANGNSTFIAQVTSQTNSNAWAKAGIMFRASSAVNAAFVDLVMTPGEGISFQSRASSTDYAVHTTNTPFTGAVWLKLVRQGQIFNGYYSSDGVNWTSLGSYTVGMPTTALVGLAVTSHSTTASSTATFANVSLSAAAAPTPLPTGWSNVDIGAPTLAGSTIYSNGVFTVTGSGSDIFNQSDQFQFASIGTSGNSTIIAQVTGQTYNNPWAKAGVMFRATDDADSAFVDLVITPGEGISFQSRDVAGDWAAHTTNTPFTGPVWLKIVRVGNVFTGYYSANGTTWTSVGSYTVTMAANVNAGLAVTSANVDASNTATFANVSVTSP